MIKRDFIQEIIEEFIRFLRKALKLKSDNSEEYARYLDQSLRDLIPFDISLLFMMQIETIIPMLKQSGQLNSDRIFIIAVLLRLRYISEIDIGSLQNKILEIYKLLMKEIIEKELDSKLLDDYKIELEIMHKF